MKERLSDNHLMLQAQLDCHMQVAVNQFIAVAVIHRIVGNLVNRDPTLDDAGRTQNSVVMQQ
jgi:hypothetical protein